jgi:3-oxoacyl-[acyl-carrier-protein] synthase II
MESRRPHGVVVTGMGIISPIGVGRELFWKALCDGQSGIHRRCGATDVPTLSAPMADYDAREYVASTHLRRMDKVSRAIVSTARLALADARLDSSTVEPTRLGIVVGSALANISESVQYLRRLFTKGPALASPMTFPNLVLNAPASYAAMELACTGANLTVSQGEVSGEQALAVGADLIRAGRADVVLAGGADELDDAVTSAYRCYRALSSQRGGIEWCSPYDVDRNGLVLGEGAAMLVLEASAHARRRGARVFAEIEDYVAFGVPAPLYDWPAQAPAALSWLRRLLVPKGADNAAVTLPTAFGVDLVCGSANSTRRLDACMLDVLDRVFGETAAGMTVTSIKGATGEFGAAGVLAAAAVCLALHTARIPPLCHLRQPPADVLLRLAPPVACDVPVRRGLMLSMARGGSAIALLMRRGDA